jgi:alkaline phosphatase D
MIINRRRVLHGAAAFAGASIIPAGVFGQSINFSDDPFTMGVASGDPDSSSVVLWTRLAPRPMEPDHGMPQTPVRVRWEVSEDESFGSILQSGELAALPESGHSVHVVVDNLGADRWYWYRFHAGAATSPVGRTRTAPAEGASAARLRYVFASCQRYENGYYAAWRHAAAENPDLVLFLGDYIYENSPRDGLPRRHNDELPTDLHTYRLRYAHYKTDPDLRAAHAAAPWMIIWDDHEVINNYKSLRAPNIADPQEFATRRGAAYQAWYEHMPVRPSLAPVGTQAKIYRTLDWGNLAAFQMIDARQYADWTDWPEREGERVVALDSELRRDPSRSLLGTEQEAWLYGQLQRSSAKWNVLAQQFVMVELRRRDTQTGEMGYGNDGWDGFPATRQRVLERLQAVSNPVVHGGDMHAFAQSDLRLSPDGPVVAPAFVGGSVSSPGNQAKMMGLMAENPDFRFAEGDLHGHGLVEVTEGEMIVTLRAVDDVTDPNSGVHDLKKFAIENGRPGATPV